MRGGGQVLNDMGDQPFKDKVSDGRDEPTGVRPTPLALRSGCSGAGYCPRKQYRANAEGTPTTPLYMPNI
jgi:hypothetical protein